MQQYPKPKMYEWKNLLFSLFFSCSRKETRTVYLRNSTLLPVAWKLHGMENLGDDFTVTNEFGVIEPMQEFALHLHFRAIKPVTVKKMIRLEVCLHCAFIGCCSAPSSPISLCTLYNIICYRLVD